MLPFQDLRLTNAAMMESYIAAAQEVLRSGRYINGESVRKFESDMEKDSGAKFCVAVSNGLDALRLILRGYKALGRLRVGDEVIVPANTFIATFLAVTDCGLKAVAADVDETTFCLDFRRLPLSERTRAVIPVHLYGNPCWNAGVFAGLRSRGILIIEDNAQAIGALSAEEGFNGSRNTGNLGDAAAISFYPAKNIGAFGDAGAVLTNDADLAAAVRKLANYGSAEKYVHELCGLNCRMDEIQAALLSQKLLTLSDVIFRRRKAAGLYEKEITNPEVIRPAIMSDGSRQVWHQYVVRHPRRDDLRKYLAENGVATEIHYPVPCHLQPCYKDNPAVSCPGPLPVAERLASEVLSLPIADVSRSDITLVADLINKFN